MEDEGFSDEGFSGRVGSASRLGVLKVWTGYTHASSLCHFLQPDAKVHTLCV